MKTCDSDYITAQQLADYVNCSIKFIRKHIESGRLPGMVKIGRVYRFRKSDIEKRLLSGQLLLDSNK
ncbi:MAG TPA: helix-turn-helix domain-containing protein [Chitinispirillaceae bacterium]|nr:helix-turn-helix domain-containing protein [Chitinispirillaceae bacterium]